MLAVPKQILMGIYFTRLLFWYTTCLPYQSLEFLYLMTPPPPQGPHKYENLNLLVKTFHMIYDMTTIPKLWFFLFSVFFFKFTNLQLECILHYLSCEFESRLWRGVLDTTLCDQVCQWLATGRWFSPGTSVSSTNLTDRHYIADILLKGALYTTNQPLLTKIY